MATRTARKPAPKIAPEPEPTPAPSARALKSQAKLELAKELIAKELESGEWVSSNDIHRALHGQITEGMYGRAKSALNVIHRRVKPEAGGKAYYEWKLPQS